MKVKKIISSLLCIATAATMAVGLSSCGKSGSSDGDTLVWYMFGDKPADLDNVLAAANEIIEEKIGVKLDMQYIDSASYNEKMRLKMAAGEEYDLAFTGYINAYQSAVDLGGLYDITELLDEVGMDEVIPQFWIDSAMVDGKVYGIPNIQVVSNPWTLMVSTELAEEIGFDMNLLDEKMRNADSYEDIEEYMLMIDDLFAKVQAARPDMYVFNPNIGFTTAPMYEAIVGDVAVRKDGSSTKLVNYYETDEWLLGIQKGREWYEKGYIRNDIASKGTSISSDDEARQYACTAASWKPGQDAVDEAKFGYKISRAFLGNPYITRTSPLMTMTSVGANSKNPKKAVEFLKLINSDKELYNIICWGIEGTHYNLDEEGKVVEIADSGYNDIGKSAWKYGNNFNSLLIPGQDADTWEQTEQMNNDAVKSPLMGFVPNTESITTEIANIANVKAEYQGRMLGTEDPANYLDEYIAKMKQAGAEKVLAEMQKQYDEFLASK